MAATVVEPPKHVWKSSGIINSQYFLKREWTWKKAKDVLKSATSWSMLSQMYTFRLSVPGFKPWSPGTHWYPIAWPYIGVRSPSQIHDPSVKSPYVSWFNPSPIPENATPGPALFAWKSKVSKMLCTSAFLTMNMGYKVNHFLEDAVTYIQPAKKQMPYMM